VSATFFYLSRNPDAYRTLAHEIRSTFTTSSEIRGASLAPCAYLRACIDEAMRLSPPSPGILWRELASDSDATVPFIVDGHVVPPGTVVGVNTYALHHDAASFHEPFAFRPERRLPSGAGDFSAEQRKAMREAFAPFSIGPRGCAGKAMAYLESSLVLAKTLWFFDFEAVDGALGRVGWEGGGRGGGSFSWRIRLGPFMMARI
jgi:cytochrome P450